MIPKALIIVVWTLVFPLSFRATDRPMVCFQTDSLIIKSDTASFFLLVDKNYSQGETHRQLIKSEVRYRLSVSKDNEANMDGMNLNCYQDKERRSYLASCLNYKEALVLIQLGQAKVYYRYPLLEITSFKVKKTGSKFGGKIERLYTDKTTHKVFFRESVYQHKWWKPKEGREY
jgi:hypothetical protein